MAQHILGGNTVVEEDGNGDTVIKNTANGNEIQLDTIIELIGSDVSIEDDEKLFFGTDNDWSIRYNSTGTEVVIRDENGATDIATVDSSGLDVTGETTTDSLGGAVSGGTTISDIASSGLEIASNGLQILSTIWDSANSEIVADVNNTNTTTDALEADSATVDNTYHYAGDDAELDTVLQSVGEGDTILLGNSTFSTNRTFDTRGLTLSGTGHFNRGTIIDGDWVLNNHIIIENIGSISNNGSLELAFTGAVADGNYGNGNTITVSGDDCKVLGWDTVFVTFESGTTGGLVDSCTTTSVTDNGTNTVGDIA